MTMKFTTSKIEKLLLVDQLRPAPPITPQMRGRSSPAINTGVTISQGGDDGYERCQR